MCCLHEDPDPVTPQQLADLTAELRSAAPEVAGAVVSLLDARVPLADQREILSGAVLGARTLVDENTILSRAGLEVRAAVGYRRCQMRSDEDSPPAVMPAVWNEDGDRSGGVTDPGVDGTNEY